VEFALLGPLMITMLLGVVQIGIGMQSYNALRGIAADVGRHVAVEYQKSNRLTNTQVRQLGEATAVQPPYLLDGSALTVNVADASPQRVAGAKEITFTVTYTVPSVLAIIDLPNFNIRFSRPIFVAI
jgi:Flp pilus assembly protein TadG